VTETDRQPTRRIPADTFAARLVLIRHDLDLTTVEAGSRCGIHYATWNTWERGGSPRNMADVVNKISRALDIDPNWLMWGINASTNSQNLLMPVDLPRGQMELALLDAPVLRSVSLSKPIPSSS
jgi:hypothetical protein